MQPLIKFIHKLLGIYQKPKRKNNTKCDVLSIEEVIRYYEKVCSKS